MTRIDDSARSPSRRWRFVLLVLFIAWAGGYCTMLALRPAPAIRFIRCATTAHGDLEAEFEIQNHCGNDIMFLGNSPSRPVYDLHCYYEGKWQRFNCAWQHGTNLQYLEGAKLYVVPAGGKASFKVDLPEPMPLRVGLDFFPCERSNLGLKGGPVTPVVGRPRLYSPLKLFLRDFVNPEWLRSITWSELIQPPAKP